MIVDCRIATVGTRKPPVDDSIAHDQHVTDSGSSQFLQRKAIPNAFSEFD